MNRCAYCGGKFGLIRPKPIITFGGPIHICSHKCREAYLIKRDTAGAARRAEATKNRWFDYLAGNTSRDPS
jgi:hypothetical protein